MAMPQAIDGLKNQVIVQRAHRYGYDHAMFLCGARVTEVVTMDDYKRACAAGNAIMTNFFNAAEEEDGVAGTAQIGREEWLRVAHEHNIPCHLDAAADMPPISNLWKYTGMGFDLVAFSGGKGMRGPQNAGLLLGKKHLTDLAQQNNNPGGRRGPRHEGGQGADRRHGGSRRLGSLAYRGIHAGRLSKTSGPDHRGGKGDPLRHHRDGRSQDREPRSSCAHTLRSFGERGNDTRKVLTALREGKPSIELNPNSGQPANQGIPSDANTLVVGVWMLQPGEDLIVGRRIREALTHRA